MTEAVTEEEKAQMSELVKYEQDGEIAWIKLNRPEKRNAINMQFAHELRDALERFRTDEGVRSGILAGEGKGFCAGGDITMFPALDALSGLQFVRQFGEQIYKSFNRMRKPLIAAVHGACIAGGFELALGCHFIYASRDSVFGMEEVRLGLLPGWGGTVRLARAVPSRLALELLLTAKRFDAEEAHDMGLVTRLFDDPEQCFDEAEKAARAIAEMPRLAVECIMDVVRQARDESDSAFSVEQLSAAVLLGSEDTHQAIGRVLARGIGD